MVFIGPEVAVMLAVAAVVVMAVYWCFPAPGSARRGFSHEEAAQLAAKATALGSVMVVLGYCAAVRVLEHIAM